MRACMGARGPCDDVSSNGAPTELGGVSTSRKHSQGGSRAWSMGAGAVLRYTRSEEDSCRPSRGTSTSATTVRRPHDESRVGRFRTGLSVVYFLQLIF